MATKNGDGFDRPTISSVEDLLERGPFAAEVAHLVARPPNDWSVRVGVYGSWGTGKTSVLNLIEEQLLTSKHVVARFNPWGSTTELEMWSVFAKQVAAAVAEKIPEIDPTTLKLSAHDAFAEGALEKLKELHPLVAAGMSLGLPLVRRFLTSAPDALKEITDQLGDRRLIVLVDDLDRLQPDLVPRALFALREVLDTPGVSFVLALDPVVVGEALGASHPGFGSGIRFLEKIVEFPRWLPEPTDSSRRRILTSDHGEYLDFFPLAALDQHISLMPKNPRSLRKFLRNLWSLRSQLSRYDSNEIDWDLLVLLWLLRDSSIDIWRTVVGDGDFETKKAARAIARRHGLVDEESDDFQNPLESLLNSTRFDDPGDRERCGRILASLSAHRSRPDGMSLVEHARITEIPRILTNKEFNSVLKATIDNEDTLASRDAELAKLAKTTSANRQSLVVDFVSKLIDEYQSRLGRSADASDEPTSEDLAADAERLLRLISASLLDSNYGIENEESANIQALKVVTSALRWANFAKSEHSRRLRNAEETLALKLLATPWMNPLPSMERMNPSEVAISYSADAAKLSESIRAVAAERIARNLVTLFGESQGISRLVFDPRRQAERLVLSDPDGPLWSGPEPLRSELLALLKTATVDGAVRENAADLLHAMVSDRTGGRGLATRGAIVGPLWEAATSVPVSRRFFRRLRDTRRALEKTLGSPLESPNWWSRVEDSFLTPISVIIGSDVDGEALFRAACAMVIRRQATAGVGIRAVGKGHRYRSIGVGPGLSELVVGKFSVVGRSVDFSIVGNHEFGGGRGQLNFKDMEAGTQISLILQVEFNADEVAAVTTPTLHAAGRAFLEAVSSSAKDGPVGVGSE